MNDAAPLPVTQRDLAKQLGISNTTVSLALRGDTRFRPETRDRILALARQLDYQPDAIAVALSHRKRVAQVQQVKAAIAWLNFWPNPKQLRSYAEFDGYWRGAEIAARKFGYHLDEFTWDTRKSLKRLEGILDARGINSVLIPPQPPGVVLEGFDWSKFSVVRFGRSVTNPEVHLVTSNQLSNTLQIVKETLRLGYRRIGYVTGRYNDFSVYFDAGFFMGQRLIPEEDRIPPLHADETTLHSTLSEWIEKYRPEAIITDFPKVQAALKHCGYRVPEDIGLAVGNIRDCDADTGIDQNPEEIGRVALMTAVSLIHDNTRGVPPIFRQILVEGTWVQGKSLPPKQQG